MFLQISGDKDEEQLLIAGKHYLNRPGFLESILNDLYNQLKQGPANNFGATLDIILLSMDRYPGEKVRQKKSTVHFLTLKKKMSQSILFENIKRVFKFCR